MADYSMEEEVGKTKEEDTGMEEDIEKG
jgi:hypothetical protein